MRSKQRVTLLVGCLAHSLNHKEGLLTLQNIATNLLAKALVAIAIQHIILKLECKTKFGCVTVNLLDIVV